ncbi:MAG: hypothetical protein LBK00_00300 [Treponema sp.]|jgi:hypothetical protein|nr:hypothetical protein [Treponema sp.]
MSEQATQVTARKGRLWTFALWDVKINEVDMVYTAIDHTPEAVKSNGRGGYELSGVT